MGKIAIVVGASGLVGSHIVKELSRDKSYRKIICLNRRPLKSQLDKVSEIIVNFEKIDSVQNKMIGDELFICLGTTIKKAGSIKAMEQIDKEIPIALAKAAQANGIENVITVSSIGANPNASNNYLRIKGEMELGLASVPFKKCVFVQPSLLMGTREEFRFKEGLSKIFMNAFGFIMIGSLKKYKGIHAQTVAKAMIKILSLPKPKIAYESDELSQLVKP